MQRKEQHTWRKPSNSVQLPLLFSPQHIRIPLDVRHPALLNLPDCWRASIPCAVHAAQQSALSAENQTLCQVGEVGRHLVYQQFQCSHTATGPTSVITKALKSMFLSKCSMRSVRACKQYSRKCHDTAHLKISHSVTCFFALLAP